MAGTLIDILKAGSAAVAVLTEVYKQAKPVIDQLDTEEMRVVMKEAGSKARIVGGKAKVAGGKAAGGIAEAARAVAGSAGTMAGKLGDARDSFLDDLSKARNEKDLEKLIKKARQTVLEAATTTITVADLQKQLQRAAETGAPGPINSLPGCIVIATYKKHDFDKDLADYVSIYVGKALNAAEGVALAISREGDPDVYADVKYKQNVRVFVFNCMPDDLDEQFGYLNETFKNDALSAR